MTRGRRAPRLRRLFSSRPALFLAFALSVMGDPVSSVAYAIEAALAELRGDAGLLIPTLGIVLVIIALVVLNYHQLVARFPKGGGAAAAAGGAFGEAWAFPPLAALVVDYALTVAISGAAATSALVAIAPGVEALRLPVAVLLIAGVAGLVAVGHSGRSAFAVMTTLFIGLALAIVVSGAFGGEVQPPTPGGATGDRSSAVAILLAFPVAMALATGIEAPSSAIAELDSLDDRGRVRFARGTLWMTLATVSVLTIGLAAVAIRLRVELAAGQERTLVSLTAEAAAGGGVLFTAFQVSTVLLLLAAASSSFQAGSGVLKALAGGPRSGILPGWLARTNARDVPYLGVGVFLAAASVLLLASAAKEQSLVIFYAVAVFVAFLFGLAAMTVTSWRERGWGFLVVNVAGMTGVLVTLVVNLTRGEPLASLAAVLALGGVFAWLWIRAGRPGGVSAAAGG